jgi:AraC-like DNA-binding protein
MDNISRDHRLFLDRVPSIRSMGIGVEYYPAYVNRQLALHSLDVVLISFILRGQGRHFIDHDVFSELGGASIAVTHYGQEQDIVTDEHGMDVLNIYLDLNRYQLPAVPPELSKILPQIIPLHPRFQHRMNRITRLQLDDPAPLEACVFALKRELDGAEIGYQQAASMLFAHFLIMCCRHAQQKGLVTNETLQTRSMKGIEALRQHIDANYHLPLSLADLAQQAQLKPTYLCRAFKSYTGKSLFDYIIDRRIQAAMMALRCTDDKILSIALAAGFNDLSYFNRRFKEFANKTPSDYRRTFRHVMA